MALITLSNGNTLTLAKNGTATQTKSGSYPPSVTAVKKTNGTAASNYTTSLSGTTVTINITW